MYTPSESLEAEALDLGGQEMVRGEETALQEGYLEGARMEAVSDGVSGGDGLKTPADEGTAPGIRAVPELCAVPEGRVAPELRAVPVQSGFMDSDAVPEAAASFTDLRHVESTGRRASDRAGWARWRRVLDATQPITPAMPLWPGDPHMVAEAAASFETEGYRLRAFRMGEHSGTHVNAPSAFLPDGVSLEDAAAWPLVAPLVVIDMRKRAGVDNACCCGVEDLLEWEGRFGRIPRGAFVACNTGWHRHWDDPRAYFGRSDDSDTIRFPSYAPGAVQWLCAERHVGGIGIDTHGVDAPDDASFSCNRTALSQGCAVVECLGSLDAVPLSGALIIVAPLPLVGGTGAPATVTVLVP